MRIVEHLGNGFPVDINDLNFPWLFDGVNLIVFENIDEKDEYIKTHYGYDEIVDVDESQ